MKQDNLALEAELRGDEGVDSQVHVSVYSSVVVADEKTTGGGEEVRKSALVGGDCFGGDGGCGAVEDIVGGWLFWGGFVEFVERGGGGG